MADFSFGSALLDRASTHSGATFAVYATQPAPSDGNVTGVGFTLSGATNVKIHLVQPLGNTVYKVRATTDCGYCGIGEHQFLGLAMPCKAGDMLAIELSGGGIEADVDGGSQIFYRNYFSPSVGDYFTAGTLNGKMPSLMAWADYITLPTSGQEIYNELDRMWADDYEGAAKWIRDHWDFEAGSLLLAELARAVILIAAGGGGGGTVNLQPILDAIGPVGAGSLHSEHSTLMTLVANAHTQILDTQTDLEGAIGAAKDEILTDAGVKELHIIEHVDALDPATSAELAAAQSAIQGTVNLRHDSLDTLLATYYTNILAAIAGVHDDTASAVDVILGDNFSGVLSAIAGVATGVTDARAAIIAQLATDVAAILQAIADQKADVKYPGPSGVTFGSSTSFVGSVLCTAAASGVNGKMDGVLVDWVSVPQSKGRQTVQGLTNYKFLGWLIFLSSDGKADEIQWLGPQSRAYTPKQLTSPGSVIVSARDASSGSIRPWVLK